MVAEEGAANRAHCFRPGSRAVVVTVRVGLEREGEEEDARHYHAASKADRVVLGPEEATLVVMSIGHMSLGSSRIDRKSMDKFCTQDHCKRTRCS